MTARIGSTNINPNLLPLTTPPPPSKPLPSGGINQVHNGGKQTHAAVAQLTADGAMAKSRVLGTQRETRAARSTSQQIRTKADWQRRALENAGINPADWRPEKGFAHNKENVQKVYAQYERLYLDHPELKWAGMAKMAGGVVYGGLQQIETNRQRAIAGGAMLSGITNPAVGIGTSAYALRELGYVEHKLLTMQKDIYDDLGWQHMAYAEGGIKALEACLQKGEITEKNLNAWHDIASGDEERIWRGNTSLLRREQFDILQHHYNDLSTRPLTGTALRPVMSMLADSPMPNGRPLRGINGTETNGNILDFNDRWRWIQTETVDRFRNYSPDYTRMLVSQPLQELVERRFARNPFTPEPQPHPSPRR